MMNRGRMAEALGEAIIGRRARRQSPAPSSIAAINNLAVVNDAYGFEVADEVIIAVGRRLRQVVRTGDAIARYSGSKFGIILNNCNEDGSRRSPPSAFSNVARESVIETERGPVWAMLSIGGIVAARACGRCQHRHGARRRGAGRSQAPAVRRLRHLPAVAEAHLGAQPQCRAAPPRSSPA